MEKPLIDEQDIALLQPFIKQWLDIYHLDLCFFYAPNKTRYINYGYDCSFDNGEFDLWRDVE